MVQQWDLVLVYSQEWRQMKSPIWIRSTVHLVFSDAFVLAHMLTSNPMRVAFPLLEARPTQE